MLGRGDGSKWGVTVNGRGKYRRGGGSQSDSGKIGRGEDEARRGDRKSFFGTDGHQVGRMDGAEGGGHQKPRQGGIGNLDADTIDRVKNGRWEDGED